MKFLVNEPAQVISYSFMFGIERMIHIFGTTDMHGILEVPDDDKYIDFLKAKFTPIEDETPITLETTGVEIKSNTTPNNGDTDKKEGKPNVNNGSAGNGNGAGTKRTRTAKSDKNDNGKKRGRRSPNKTRPSNANTNKNKNSTASC